MADYPSLISLYKYNSSDVVTNIRAISVNPNSIQLTWTSPTSVTVSGYEIYQAYTKDLIPKYIGTTTNTQYIISGLENNRDYYYSIKTIYYDIVTQNYIPPVFGDFLIGFQGFGLDYLTNITYSQTSGVIGNLSYIPSGLIASGYGTTSDQIRLSWNQNYDTSIIVSGYRIWRSNDSFGVYSSIGSTLNTEYIDSGLLREQTYYYKVTTLY